MSLPTYHVNVIGLKQETLLQRATSTLACIAWRLDREIKRRIILPETGFTRRYFLFVYELI